MILIRGIIRWNHQNHQTSHWKQHKRPAATTHRFCRGWWNMPDASCPDVEKVVTGKRHSKDCMVRKGHKNLSHLVRKVLGRQIATDPMNRMNTRYQYGMWLGMRNNSAECFIDGVVRKAREITRLESQNRWDTEAVDSVIGELGE